MKDNVLLKSFGHVRPRPNLINFTVVKISISSVIKRGEKN